MIGIDVKAHEHLQKHFNSYSIESVCSWWNVAILGGYIIDGESKIRENTLLFYQIEL